MNIPIEKKCFICGKVKPIDEFYKHSQMGDGHLNKCKECTKAYMKKRQQDGLIKDIDWRRHHQNPDRYRKHCYYGIRTRCTLPYRKGAIKGKKYRNSYYGREYLSQEEWDEWCVQSDKTFMSLWVAWVESGYENKKSPSIDRIDNDKGYVVGNLQWMTKEGNMKKYIDEVMHAKEKYV